MVLFDLPTTTKSERKQYTKFREFLLDEGFEMAQFSVYIRHTSGRDAVKSILKRIELTVPPQGKIDVLQFTDKQYADIVCLRGKKRAESPKNPTQLALF